MAGTVVIYINKKLEFCAILFYFPTVTHNLPPQSKFTTLSHSNHITKKVGKISQVFPCSIMSKN
jgi:hypothetical protein